MTHFRTVFVGLAAIVLTLAIQTSPAQAAEAAWQHRWDTTVDGRVRDPQTQRWSITLDKNRLKGSLLNEKGDTNDDWRITGDVSEGKTPIVRLTIEGPNKAIFHLIGKMTKDGQIVGVYYGVDGSSGDFDLILDK